MSDLKPCLMCGDEHHDLMGYDFHKVSCSNSDCPISGLTLTKEQWNTRIDPQELTTLRQQNAELVGMLEKYASRISEDGFDLKDIDRDAIQAQKFLRKIQSK